MSDPVRIVYIAGVQNSGSTMLDAILGNAPGVRSLGEVGRFYECATAEAPCVCGEAPAACPPCAAAVEGLARCGPLDDSWALLAKPRGGHQLSWLVRGSRTRRAYAERADAMFRAVAADTGASVLVDSSKNVGRLASLLGDSTLDIRVIHLVRDPRGYLRSRARRASWFEQAERPSVLLAHWLVKNLLTSAAVLGRRTRGHRLVRYEDLILTPHRVLGELGDFLGIEVSGLADRALQGDIDRGHLYESPRRVDYAKVRLEPSRLSSQVLSEDENNRFWTRGGFLAAPWGYRRRQLHPQEL